MINVMVLNFHFNPFNLIQISIIQHVYLINFMQHIINILIYQQFYLKKAYVKQLYILILIHNQELIQLSILIIIKNLIILFNLLFHQNYMLSFLLFFVMLIYINEILFFNFLENLLGNKAFHHFFIFQMENHHSFMQNQLYMLLNLHLYIIFNNHYLNFNVYKMFFFIQYIYAYYLKINHLYLFISNILLIIQLFFLKLVIMVLHMIDHD